MLLCPKKRVFNFGSSHRIASAIVGGTLFASLLYAATQHPAAAQFATVSAAAPAPPTGLIATPGKNQVSLSWFASGESNVANYRVYQSAQENGPWTQFVGNITTPRYTADNLAGSTPQYFKVSAVSAGGKESALSYAVVATPSDKAGTVYEVGTGKAYTSLASIPWSKLAPGDMVKINWRTEPYREKILLSNSGTVAKPIRIFGVPGPLGQLPVIDGQDAATGKDNNYTWSGFAGNVLVMVGRRADQEYNYTPSNISIEGLEVRGASQENFFTNISGTKQQYGQSASGIYLYQGTNITIRGCAIHGNGNGLFGLPIGRNVLVQGNYIYDNGAVGSDRQHSVYTECIGVTFEYNVFGATRANTYGSLLKDRSAGTVIRYNTFRNGNGSRVLDLVEPQDGGATIYNDPSFAKTFVYGNVIDYQNGGRPVHYGADQGFPPAYRRGVLYFYNNTVVVRADASSSWRTEMFYLDTNDATVDARNNIFYTASSTPGAAPTNFSIITQQGSLNLGVNWISPGWGVGRDGVAEGTITGKENMLTNTANNPGFVSLAQNDFRLNTNSAALDKGTAQSSGVPDTFFPTLQYLFPQAVEPRIVVRAIDLGALEQYASSTPTPTPSPTPHPTPTPKPTPTPTPKPTPHHG